MSQVAYQVYPSRREDIIKAATRVFLADGYGATSIDNVAREAGVSKPTIYKHFESKEQLFCAVVQLQAEKLVGPMSLNLHAMSLKEALETFGQKIMDICLTDEVLSLYRILIAEGRKFPEMEMAFQTCSCNPLRESFVTYIKDLAGKGTINVSDASLAACQFMGLIQQPTFWAVMLGRQAVPDQDRQQEVLSQAVDMFLTKYA